MNEYNIHIKHIYVYLCNLLQSVWFYWNHFNVYIYIYMKLPFARSDQHRRLQSQNSPRHIHWNAYIRVQKRKACCRVYIYTCIYDVFLKYFIDFWFSVYQYIYIYNYIYTYIFRDQQHTHIHKTLKNVFGFSFHNIYIYIYFEIKIYTTSIKRWFVIYT